MRGTAFILIALSGPLLFSACTSDVTPVNKLQPWTITANNRGDADDLQRQFDARCESASDCNPSVALLIEREDDVHLGICTASLIGPDLLLTNKHCLPSDLRENGADCSGRVILKFPASDEAEAAQADCATVLAVSSADIPASGAGKPQPDYAILQLAQAPGRPALEIDRSGVIDGESLTIVRMTPNEGARQGTIGSIRCHATMNTVLVPLYNSPTSPIVDLNSCPIVHGNSGSPVIGADGLKALVMEGAADPNKMQQEGLRPLLFGVATNLACLNEAAAGFGASIDPHCREDLSDAASQALLNQNENDAMADENFAPLISNSLARAAALLPSYLHWTTTDPEAVQSQPPARTFEKQFVVPSCFRSPIGAHSWIEAYRNPGQKTYLDTVTVDAKAIELDRALGVDDQNRPAGRVLSPMSAGELTFSPSQIAHDGHSLFTLTRTSDGASLSQADLQACSP